MISGLLTAAGIAGSALFGLGCAISVQTGRTSRTGGCGAVLMVLAGLGALAWHFT